MPKKSLWDQLSQTEQGQVREITSISHAIIDLLRTREVPSDEGTAALILVLGLVLDHTKANLESAITLLRAIYGYSSKMKGS